MDADSPGYAVILNNVQFKYLDRREDSVRNVQKLRNLFKNHGLKVLEETDLSAKVCKYEAFGLLEKVAIYQTSFKAIWQY